MASCNADVPRHVSRGFETEGEMAPAMMRSAEGPDGAGWKVINGKKNRVASFHNSRGAGLFMQTENEYGQGDGMTPAPGPRGSKHFAAGTADNSKPTFVKLSNTDGSMLSFAGGGGSKSTIQLATGDGMNGILITDGFIALYTGGTYMVLDRSRGLVFMNKNRVMEGPPGSAKNASPQVFSA